MRTAFRIDALFGQPQTLYRPPVDQVLLHDFRGIFWLHMPIPYRFRINHHRWPVLALVQAAGLVDANRASQPCSLGDLLQLRV